MSGTTGQAECPQCHGYGTVINSFSEVRRCGACKGKKVVDQRKADKARALRELSLAIHTCPDWRVRNDAPGGLAWLRDNQPEREDAMIDAILDGKVTQVVRYLAKLYNIAYPG